MSTTKRTIIKRSYSRNGLAGYVFDIQPEEWEEARQMLDSMMAEWESIGIMLGYSAPTDPDDSDLDDDSGLPDTSISAVIDNLAVLIGPNKGKQVPIEVKVSAKRGYDRLLAAFARIPEMQFPNNLPMGEGNKRLPISQNYFQPRDNVTATTNGDVLDLGDGHTLPA